MLTLIWFLVVIPTLTVVITLGFWYWFNRDNKKAIELKGLLIDIGKDTSKLYKDLKGLSLLVGEVAQPLLTAVAQPLLSAAAIDVESKGMIQEKNDELVKREIKDEVDVQALVTDVIKAVEDMEVEPKSEIIEEIENLGEVEVEEALEIKNEKIQEDEDKNEVIGEFVEDTLEEVKGKIEDEVKDDVRMNESDETKVFLELIKTDDDMERLEDAMAEWRAKGNERLALECAIAIEQLKVKRDGKKELTNLWSDDELNMEEDIAS